LSITFRLLTVLLAATPVFGIAEGVFAQHVIQFLAATMLAVAAMAPQAEMTTTVQLLKRFSLAMLFPVIWMVLQIVPLPFASPANPIWSSASIALNEPALSGHISVDPGDTLRSLVVYSTILALIVATIIVTRDRQRAETTLFVLSAVTAFMSAEVLLNQSRFFVGITLLPGAGAGATFVAISALGTIANTATIIRAVERHLSRRALENSSSGHLFSRLFLGLVGTAICLAAMRALAPSNVSIGMVLGLAVMVVVAVARPLALRPWLLGTLFAILAVMAAFIVAQRFQNNPLGELLGFATSPSVEAVAWAQRALSNARWLGSGVGTFSWLARIYQDFGTVPIVEPPTTVVSMAIEWGRPALLILVAFAIQLFVFTLRGALRRGRDSFFPAATAAVLTVIVCEAFCDSSLMHAPVQIITAVFVGLGISQSVGRTSGLR
jgi:hypothetical protein